MSENLLSIISKVWGRCGSLRDDRVSYDEKEELEAARKKPIVFDEDCPETTIERALEFRRVNPVRDTGVKMAMSGES